MKNKGIISKLLVVLIFILTSNLNSGCKKFVDVNAPISSINSKNVFDLDATATSTLTGIYTEMSAGLFTAAITINSSLSSDELILLDINNSDYYQLFSNELVTPQVYGTPADFWTRFYPIIYRANAIIEGLNSSSKLSPKVRQQLLGEALFIRAFAYFYLVNFYGDVPLVITTDYKVNSVLSRTSKTEVYQQIIKDLIDAKELLNSEYVGGDGITTGNGIERVRPNKFSAIALLARVYLYINDYSNAEAAATSVIEHSLTYNLSALNSAFQILSKEVIWSVQSVGANNSYGANTEEGRKLILPDIAALNGTLTFGLRKSFVDALDARDLRKTNWIGVYNDGTNNYYYPYKYKKGAGVTSSSEYSVVLRLAEQYLIRAESRIHRGNIAAGVSDLNVLRSRATDLDSPINDRLPQLSPELSTAEALSRLEYERQAELFTEMGHRWFDLKRTKSINNGQSNRANEVLGSIKAATWSPNDELYPIPLPDILRNPSLAGKQNPGYQ